MFGFRKRQRVRRRRRTVSNKERAHYAMHREHARALIHERLAFWNTHYAVTYSKVFIRNQCSRWGSCSSQRNLNFNYKIAFLPQELLDYVIVHELCHLIEFNHSPAFWLTVERVIPDYRERRALLEKQEIRVLALE